jgi:hypothetical protein
MEEQTINNDQNSIPNAEGKSPTGCIKIISGFVIQLLIIILVFVITWHFAVAFTIKSIQGVLDFTRKTVKEYISVNYGEGKEEQKLVVFTQNLDVEIDKDEDNRILWDWISVGSARLKVKFLDNKVQYFVPLHEIKDNHIMFDPERRTIKIVCPPVFIDKDMVVIQTDPDKIIREENGTWSPFGPKMKDLNYAVQKGIHEKTLRMGFTKDIRLKAEAAAKKALEELFNKILAEFLKKENLNLELVMP